MTPKTCQHVKNNGTLCTMNTLRDSSFCYYHQRDRQRRTIVQRGLDNRRYCFANPKSELAVGVDLQGFDDDSAAVLRELDLPLLEDATAISVALTNIVRVLVTQQISVPRAKLALYAVQIASSNLTRLSMEGNRAEARHIPKADSDPNPIFPDAVPALAEISLKLHPMKSAAHPPHSKDAICP